jgi:lipopolysaccharide export system ATP-binding protein
MSLLECVNLVKQYPSKRAVDGVSFHVEPGEIVGLLGPNGAGKSTSFSMAVGLVTPTEGRVFFNGVDVTRWPLYKRAQHGMGYLPQKDSIFGKLSAEQNLYAVLEFQPMSYRDRMARADELLDRFGLLSKRKQLSSTLSGGERRRLELARCLASDPKLILLDEPFPGIDPVTIHSIQDMIADLRRQGIAILLTDHRETETLTITDRNYIVCGGRILANGDAETVLGDEQARRHYFGTRFDIDSILRSRDAFQGNRASENRDMPINTAA